MDKVELKPNSESSSSDAEEQLGECLSEKPGPEVNTTNNDFIQSLSGSDLKIFNDIYTACLTNNATKLEQILTNAQVNF